MKKAIKLEREDLDAMHDVIFEALGVNPDDDMIQYFWDIMPEDIKDIAISWGYSDRVFCDDMYKWLENLK